MTLTFTEDNANEPIISQAIRKYLIDVNVVYGKIQQTNEGSFGALTVLLTGETAEIDKALRFCARTSRRGGDRAWVNHFQKPILILKKSIGQTCNKRRSIRYL